MGPGLRRGGVAGLARAYEYTQAFPCDRALVLALELSVSRFSATI